MNRHPAVIGFLSVLHPDATPSLQCDRISAGTATECSTAQGAATMVQMLHTLFVILALAAQVPRPDSSARVVGRIRDDRGQPVVGALIPAIGTTLGARSDSPGPFDLRGLPPGPTQLRTRAIGLESVDTTVSLRRAERLVWNGGRPAR